MLYDAGKNPRSAGGDFDEPTFLLYTRIKSIKTIVFHLAARERSASWRHSGDAIGGMAKTLVADDDDPEIMATAVLRLLFILKETIFLRPLFFSCALFAMMAGLASCARSKRHISLVAGRNLRYLCALRADMRVVKARRQAIGVKVYMRLHAMHLGSCGTSSSVTADNIRGKLFIVAAARRPGARNAARARRRRSEE